MAHVSTTTTIIINNLDCSIVFLCQIFMLVFLTYRDKITIWREQPQKRYSDESAESIAAGSSRLENLPMSVHGPRSIRRFPVSNAMAPFVDLHGAFMNSLEFIRVSVFFRRRLRQ